MSTDLKIELFAKDLFNYLWKHHGLKEPPPKSKHPPRKSEFNENIFRAVQSRQAMFAKTYDAMFETIHGEFVGNSTDFFDAIVDSFPHYVDWAKNPNPEMVMSLFLYSCAFVANLCMWCKARKDYFLDVGPKAWAMFVDMHVKDKFRSHGEWKKLRKFVDHDAVVHDYFVAFSQARDCGRGKGVLFHAPHLTCGAVESFDEFEAWEGVDDDAPTALKWVDYCVHVPFMKIRNLEYYQEPSPEVFQKMEDAMLDLGYILNPDREGDYFEGDSDAMESPTDALRKSQTAWRTQLKSRKEDASGFPIAPVSRLDTGLALVQNYDSDGEDLTATDPNNILRPLKTAPDPAHAARLAIADRMCAMIAARKAARNPEIDSFVTETVEPRKISGVVDREKCGELKSSAEEIIGTEAKTALNSSLSTDDDKNLPPVDSNSHIQLDLDKSLEEEEGGLLPIAIVLTPNKHYESQSKNNIDEIVENALKQLGLEKFSEYEPLDSPRKVDVYLKAVDLDNAAILGDGQKNTPVKSPPPNVNVLSTPRKSLISPNVNILSTPRKSPLTSPNVNILSTLCKSPLTSPNVNVLSTPRKSPLTSPNVNILSTPRKSPLTSPNVNILSTPRKSPLTSPNVNVLSTQRRSPLTSPNVNILSTPRKSPLTSPNVNVLGTPDGNLLKKINASSSSVSSRKSPAGKENSTLSKPKAEIKRKSPHQKNVKTNSTSPDSKEEADVQKLKRVEDKCVKDSFCPGQLHLDIDDPSKDEKYLLHLPTPKPLKTDNGVKKDNAIILKSFLKSPSYDPMWSGLDVRHQNPVLVNDEDNDSILDRSLKLLEPASKNDLSRPSIEREYGLGNRRISYDSAVTYQVTDGGNSSVDQNQFKLVPEAGVKEETKNKAKITLDCGKSLKAEKEMTSADTTDENQIGLDGEKAKKPKLEVNLTDSNLEALQTSQKDSTTAESVLENPSELSSEPQDVEKKGKKKKQKKRLTRLEQRIKEEGEGVLDVTRLIFVMGHQPGMESVAAAFQGSKKQTTNDDDNEK